MSFLDAAAPSPLTMNFPDSLERHRQSLLEAMKIQHYSPASLDHRSDSLGVFFRHMAN